MAFKTTDNKWTLARAFINLWLKDKSKYCNNCGAEYKKELYPCCENPYLSTNWEITQQVIKQNKEIRKTRLNDLASTKNKTLRWGVSLPPKLYHDLNCYFKQGANESLFKNRDDVREFAKEFKPFQVPERM